MKMGHCFGRIFFFSLISSVHAFEVQDSNGNYNTQVDGFYLGHFDNVGTLNGCRNFESNLFRGGRPDLKSRTWIQHFRMEKIDYVVDLRSEATKSSEDAIVDAGITYIHLPLYTGGTKQPTPSQLKIHAPGKDVQLIRKDIVDVTLDLLNLVEQVTQEGHKVYIHCARGEDRTGVIVGLLRKCAQWKTEFRSYGGVEYEPLKWLRLKVEARKSAY